MDDTGSSFPKSDLTNRLYSTHRNDVNGALTDDSPAAAQAMLRQRSNARKFNKKNQTNKTNNHPLSQSSRASRRRGGSTSRMHASASGSGSSGSGGSASSGGAHKEGSSSKKMEEKSGSNGSNGSNRSLLASSSSKTMFNTMAPPSSLASRGVRKNAWQTPKRSGRDGNAPLNLSTFVATTTKEETSKYEEVKEHFF